ncbi:uncharacterized protein LOC116412002 [Xenopus tropicalis]|uniref:Uncharacterized protein LOC116412002 n=1 Tax=Xenopus tropicalis TaxID=8364 RepID=A0A8J1JSA8_XENTR|nr:uncharacterized protein LOC116412002 [Xenopus tropicalis]
MIDSRTTNETAAAIYTPRVCARCLRHLRYRSECWPRGGRSSSGLHSPRRHPEIEGERFSGEESERGSHVGGSDVAFFSDEEPANIPQQQLPTQATGESVAPTEHVKEKFHKSLIRHHKALMKKLDTMHIDLCVATNAYNAAQARQAAHEAAMLSLQQEMVTLHQASEARKEEHEAAMLSLQEEQVELKRQKVALLAQQNVLLQQQAPKPTEPTSSTSTAPPPAGSTRQLRKRK